jgi:hypothetical protein
MANPTPPSPTPIVANAFQQPPSLTQIQTKVRRLTRNPGPGQLSDTELNNYINTFIVYDFPEQLRTFNSRKSFTFYTNPGQDVYNTDIASYSGATTNLLYNFQNLYMTVHPPVYISGFQGFYSQSREQFFGIYPQVRNILFTGQNGNGTPGPFTGVINTQQTLPSPANNQLLGLLQGHVLFNCEGTYGTGEIFGMSLVDVPVVDPVTGYKLQVGNLYDPNSAAYQAAIQTPPTVITSNNNINYLTGVFTITFSANTIAGVPINSQTVPMNLAQPQAILYYNNQFTVRPVPDQSYPVNFEVYQRPTALLATGQNPELEEYWQYIAYGAAKKIFEDRMETDNVQMIMPEFKVQERLVLRRTLVQHSNERTATIYTENVSGMYGSGWYSGGGQF